MKRVLTFIILVFGVTAFAAQVTFVGVMSHSKQTFFAVRSDETSPVKWVSIGDKFGEFLVVSYDAKNEALTFRNGIERIVLTLPGAQVRLAPDEVVAGLQKILNLQGAETLCDLLHPKLKPLFKPADCDSSVYRSVLMPGTKSEILELTNVESEALKDGLDAVEKVVGVRPKHGVWTTHNDGGRSMSFVISVGASWYLAPSVPRDQ